MFTKLLTLQAVFEFLAKMAKNPDQLAKIEERFYELFGKKPMSKSDLLDYLQSTKSVPSIVIDDVVDNKLQVRIIENGVYHGIAGVTKSSNPNSPNGGAPIEIPVDLLFDLKKLIDTTIDSAGLQNSYDAEVNNFNNIRNHLIGATQNSFLVETIDIDDAISASTNWDDSKICDAAHNFVKLVTDDVHITAKEVEQIWPAIRPYFIFFSYKKIIYLYAK